MSGAQAAHDDVERFRQLFGKLRLPAIAQKPQRLKR